MVSGYFGFVSIGLQIIYWEAVIIFVCFFCSFLSSSRKGLLAGLIIYGIIVLSVDNITGVLLGNKV